MQVKYEGDKMRAAIPTDRLVLEPSKLCEAALNISRSTGPFGPKIVSDSTSDVSSVM